MIVVLKRFRFVMAPLLLLYFGLRAKKANSAALPDIVRNVLIAGKLERFADGP